MMPQSAVKERARIELPPAPWSMHEFFAGSGLVAYGLKGLFSSIWANDISEKKAKVYTENFGSEHFLLNDIRNVHGADLPFAHLSWASFPCQDLSLAGSIGGIFAPRSGLVWEWLRVLDELEEQPKLLALENVTGLLSTNHGENYCVLHQALVDRGFRCGAIVINASLFLPQSRPRVFILAVKKDCRIPKELTNTEPCWLHTKAAIELGKRLPGWIWWNTDKPRQERHSLRDILQEGIPYDKDYALRLIPKQHLLTLNERETVYATGYRRMRNGVQQMELRFDGIAGCLRTPEGGSSKQYLVVKKNGATHARLLTVREAARLMGAPEEYVLPGTYNDGYLAMGDAVAAPVARFLGERFLKRIAEAVYDDSRD